MKCHSCSHAIDPGNKFCPNCGVAQKNSCHHCHADLSDFAANNVSYCPNCGAARNPAIIETQLPSVKSEFYTPESKLTLESYFQDEEIEAPVVIANDVLDSAEWWNKKWWATCNIVMHESSKYLFKNSSKSTVVNQSILDIVSSLIRLNNSNKQWPGVKIELFDSANARTLLEITTGDDLDMVHINFTPNEKSEPIFRNGMKFEEAVEFLEELNLNGPNNTFNSLPKPPWEKA